MWLAVVLIYLGITLGQISSVSSRPLGETRSNRAAGQEAQKDNEYSPFELEAFMEGSFHVIFEGTVSRLRNVEEYPIFWEEMRGHYKHLSDADFLRYSKNGEFFKYTYVFRNMERTKLKVNLSAWEIVDSPLVDILQDFSLNIGSDEARVEISFIAPGPPAETSSPFNIMFWREGGVSQGSWILFRAGTSRVYRPPVRIYIRKEVETVIRKVDGQQ